MYGRSDFIAALAARLAWWGRVGVGLKVLFPRRMTVLFTDEGTVFLPRLFSLGGYSLASTVQPWRHSCLCSRYWAPSKQRSPRLREHLSGPAFGQRVRGIVSVTYAHVGLVSPVARADFPGVLVPSNGAHYREVAFGLRV